MSDRIAVFNDGRIQQLATPADLYEKPENSFVAQFIGENNRLRGVTRGLRDGRAEVELADGTRLEALAVRAELGAPTQISIRPERIEIDPEASDVGVEGRVREVIYFGDHVRMRLSVFDDDDCIVKLANGAERRRFRGRRDIAAGLVASRTAGRSMFEGLANSNLAHGRPIEEWIMKRATSLRAGRRRDAGACRGGARPSRSPSSPGAAPTPSRRQRPIKAVRWPRPATPSPPSTTTAAWRK